MKDWQIEVTDEYERLVQFFVANELEFDGDEEVDTDIVKCWKVEEKKDAAGAEKKDAAGRLIAGCVLALRQGKYIIDGIAVDEAYRQENIGRALVDKVIMEIRERGASELYLVARAPGFFRRLGFEKVAPEEAPLFFECAQCPQYQKTCHPEIMRLAL